MARERQENAPSENSESKGSQATRRLSTITAEQRRWTADKPSDNLFDTPWI
jgi:hypothetical protein